MARKKQFTLKFTDSLLFGATDLGYPGGTCASSTIADEIFNDPDSWSDTSLSTSGESGSTTDDGDEDEGDEQLVPVSAGVVATSGLRRPRPAEFVLKPSTSKYPLLREAYCSLTSSV